MNPEPITYSALKRNNNGLFAEDGYRDRFGQWKHPSISSPKMTCSALSFFSTVKSFRFKTWNRQRNQKPGTNQSSLLLLQRWSRLSQCENCFVSLVTSSAVMTKGSPFQNGGLTRVRLHPPTTNKPRSTPSPCCGPDSTATVALQCQVNKGTLLRKKGCQALPEELSNKKPGFRRLEEGFG